MAHRTLVLPDFARYFFAVIVASILLLFAWVVSPFFQLLVYATLVVVIFYPMNVWLQRRFHLYPSLASLLTTLFVSLVVLIPLALFVVFLAQEAVNVYAFLSNKWVGLHVDELQWAGLHELPVVGPWLEAFAERYGFSEFIYETNIDLVQFVKDATQSLAGFLVSQSGNIIGAVSSTFLYVVIFMVTLFYFFRDGLKFILRLKVLSPLPARYETEIENKLIETIHAIVMGGFVTSLLQGFVAALAFFLAGVDNVIFWATMVAFASLIPYVGAAFVWLPISLALILSGNMIWGVFLLLWGFCVISTVDNVARPFLIGSRARMHPLLMFIVVLGGIFVFGIEGIIFGPLILSLTVAILHIYQLEYGEILKD